MLSSARSGYRYPSGKDHGTRGSPGNDGAKKGDGRKRYLLVETTDLLRRALVHAAQLSEAATAPWLLALVSATCTRLQRM
jgi:hypothetical protein